MTAPSGTPTNTIRLPRRNLAHARRQVQVPRLRTTTPRPPQARHPPPPTQPYLPAHPLPAHHCANYALPPARPRCSRHDRISGTNATTARPTSPCRSRSSLRPPLPVPMSAPMACLEFVAAITLSATLPCPCRSIDYTIAGFWDDLALSELLRYTMQGCGVFTSLSGTAPNRILYYEWRGLAWYADRSMDFEIRLHENQQELEVDLRHANRLGTASVPRSACSETAVLHSVLL